MGKAFLRFVVLATALLVAGCGSSDRAKDVEFADLVSDPQKYQGRFICTAGVYLHGFEASDLAASTYSQDGALYLTQPVIWLEGADIRSRSNCHTPESRPIGEFCQVTVCGVFEAGGGYGHVGGYQYQIRAEGE